MKKRVVCLCLLLAVVLLCATLLLACTRRNSKLTLVWEGDLYRGASGPLYADVDNSLVGEVTFTIDEGFEYSYIHNGQLSVRTNAPVGAQITVTVTAGTLSTSLTKTVRHTPVKAVSVQPMDEVAAGQSVTLHAVIEPAYANDNVVTYRLAEGTTCATLDGNVLQVAPTADRADSLVVYAQCGEADSEGYAVPISTVQPRQVLLSADRTLLQQGQSAHLSGSLLPVDASASIRYSLVRSDYADWYVALEGDTVSVKARSPEGTFAVQATAGALCEELTFTVEKTPVKSVYVTRGDNSESEMVTCGSTVPLSVHVYPDDATYPQVTYSVLDGDEFIRINALGQVQVITREVGVSFVIRVTADGVYRDIRFVTKGIEVSDIALSVAEQSTSVMAGDRRTIVMTVTPSDASTTPLLLIESGEEYATLAGNVVTFNPIKAGEPTERFVRVMAVADAVQRYITFHVVPKAVQQVVLSTTDATQNLNEGDSVTLQAVVSPADATFAEVTYVITQGYGTLTDNRFIVTAQSWGEVRLAAVADGVYSNELVLSVQGRYNTPAYANWSDLDNNADLLKGYSAVCLDLRGLGTDANDTVIIVSDDVKELLLEGGYDGTTSSIIHNLYLYFLTTNSIHVILRNVGIVIDNGYTDTVLDFGDRAGVTLSVTGNNAITAGSAYCTYATDFTVDGVYDTTTTMLQNGMDGFGGMNGGTAVSAYSITLDGDGTLLLCGGDASSGTDGGKGADAPVGAYGGNGGNGGDGGVGGAAIQCYTITYAQTGSISLYAGASATGGVGGAAGKGSARVYDGVKGRDGVSGTVAAAVVAQETTVQTVMPAFYVAGIRANSVVRPLGNLGSTLSSLRNHYKVSIVYGEGWSNLYALQYKMTQQTNVAELFRLLRGMDYALAVFGRNLLWDVAARKEHGLVFYLCDTIKSSGGGVVYGLTDKSANVWFATFETKPRDTFYSTYYNIMVHEVFHLLYYSMDEDGQSAKALADSVLRINYNNNYYYMQTALGVYNGSDENAPFLTTYSKKNGMEDISETLSMLCVTSYARPFAAATARVGKKALYITQQFVDEYHALGDWQRPYWLRYVN